MFGSAARLPAVLGRPRPRARLRRAGRAAFAVVSSRVRKLLQEYAQEALEAVHGTGVEAGAAASGGLGSGNTLGVRAGWEEVHIC